ncbi:MAG: methyltransferase domain-containing protein [Burkholderiaceae bacterium]
MKNSKIIGLNQFPMADILKKLFPSHRNKIFDEFVKFKNNDTNVTTLCISAEEQEGDDHLRYLFTWNKPRELPQNMAVNIDQSSSGALFSWDAEKNIMRQLDSPGSSKDLPFGDGSFDWVFCDAVIEHVGGSERQYLLLKELMRVARKGIFVTTSNRWHPIEFYTALPLLHWLPISIWKRVLQFLGKEGWASGSMLNLLDAKALQNFVNRLPQKPQCSIGHIRFLGLKAYFFLQIKKNPPQAIVNSYAACKSNA